MSTAEHLRVIEGHPTSDPLIGQTIDGRYLIERVLGEGGMGLVYRAKHIVLGKLLAMKVLRPDVSRDEEIITRFRQEAQSASSIGNQHIIDISDFGVLPDGSTYFVMEYLDGIELTKAVERESPLPFPRIVHVVKQLCDALGAAHLIGIVHRDLKPDNVYLIKRGQDVNFVKVLDFGIAKVGGSSSKLTRAGQVFGTPHYMSPEQCAGSGVDHRTDIYAIGIMLYEMVTGRVPFDADNLMGILTKHLYEEPIRPSQLRPDCPPELEAIILRCIAKQQDIRYQHCSELADDLSRLEAGIIPAAMSMTIPRAPTMPGSVSSQGTMAPTSKSKTGLIVGGLVLALVGAGAAGVFVMSQQQQQAEQAQRAALAEAQREAQRQQQQLAAQAQAQPQTPVPAEKIRLTTEPAGAEVYRGDEFIGATPLEIPRPAGAERFMLEFRKEGFESRQATLSNITAGEVNFVLTPSRGSNSGARPPTGTRPPNGTAAAQGNTQSEPAMAPPAMRPPANSEVLDPWAN